MSESEANLAALQLRLRPKTELLLERDEMRVSYWLFLQLVARVDAALAEELRTPGQLRPFTVGRLQSPGLGARWNGRIGSDSDCYLRITGLTRPVVAVLEQIKQSPPQEVPFGEQTLTVEEILLEENAAARTGLSSYRAILEDCFYQTKSAPNSFPIRFLSPTGFKSDRQEITLPLPPLVFGSLLQRWNTFSPGPLADDSRLFAELALRPGRFRIESHSVVVDQQPHSGFTGYVDFRASGKDKFYLQTLEALWRYSFYAGIGYQTAAGLGQVQPLLPGARY